jgi:hypothetical protein
MNLAPLRPNPVLKERIGLPITFRLLKQTPLRKETDKNLFVYVSIYQGYLLTDPLEKPYSKIINWEKWHEFDII